MRRVCADLANLNLILFPARPAIRCYVVQGEVKGQGNAAHAVDIQTPSFFDPSMLRCAVCGEQRKWTAHMHEHEDGVHGQVHIRSSYIITALQTSRRSLLTWSVARPSVSPPEPFRWARHVGSRIFGKFKRATEFNSLDRVDDMILDTQNGQCNNNLTTLPTKDQWSGLGGRGMMTDKGLSYYSRPGKTPSPDASILKSPLPIK